MKRLRAFIALALTAIAAVGASADPQEIPVEADLRDTGYMLGDLLDERIDLHLPGTFVVDADSLPLPGRVAPWLEVRRTSLGAKQPSGAQALVVTYQIFAETEQAARVPLPEFLLRVRDGAVTQTVSVPSRTFLLSPGLPPTLTDRDRELRPSPPPVPLVESASLTGALASLLLALICAAYLLWRHDLLPFLPRAPGPLARAWRRWRRRRALTSEQHAALMRDMHVALCRSAGETLYPSTLARLFERAPYLQPLRERIVPLFEASWRTFYEEGAGARPSTASVLALLHDAADRERGVPC